MSSKQTRAGYWKAYYAAHRARRLAEAKQYAKDHPTEQKAYWKAHYAANREKDLAESKRWRQSHQEHSKAYHHAYYLAHKAHIMASGRSYYARNAARVIAVNKAWNTRNPGKHSQIVANHNAKRRGASGSHTAQEWREKCELFAYCCVYCGERKPLERDHNIPLSKGGTNDIMNILPACRSCNVRKHARTAVEFIAYRAKVAA